MRSESAEEMREAVVDWVANNIFADVVDREEAREEAEDWLTPDESHSRNRSAYYPPTNSGKVGTSLICLLLFNNFV